MIDYDRNNLFIRISYIFHSKKYMQYEAFLVFLLWASFFLAKTYLSNKSEPEVILFPFSMAWCYREMRKVYFRLTCIDKKTLLVKLRNNKLTIFLVLHLPVHISSSK